MFVYIYISKIKYKVYRTVNGKELDKDKEQRKCVCICQKLSINFLNKYRTN